MYLNITEITALSCAGPILVIPPYPYCIEEENNDVLLKTVGMLAHTAPLLLFTCYLRPTGGIPPKNANYRYCPDDLCYNLVFFSTFEELKLPIWSVLG